MGKGRTGQKEVPSPCGGLIHCCGLPVYHLTASSQPRPGTPDSRPPGSATGPHRSAPKREARPSEALPCLHGEKGSAPMNLRKVTSLTALLSFTVLVSTGSRQADQPGQARFPGGDWTDGALCRWSTLRLASLPAALCEVGMEQGGRACCPRDNLTQLPPEGRWLWLSGGGR